MDDRIAIIVLFTYYVLTVALLPTVLRLLTTVPGEIVRKLRHVSASLSVFILLELFSSWISAVIALIVIVAFLYPTFRFLERQPKLMALFADRGDAGKDLHKQATLALLVFAILIAWFWGGLDQRYIIVVAVLTWGFGDAAAAIVGKLWGKTKLKNRLIQKNKTLEGACAMIGLSMVVTFASLVFYGNMSWYLSLFIAAFVSPLAAFAELLTGRGLDTITVPFTVAITVWGLVHLLIGFG